jgi:dimethylargininase
VTKPGATSRSGEIKPMTDVLKTFYDNIEHITHPGTIEAGDIMMVGDHYFIGISERTNNEGADQMIRLLSRYDLTGSKVSLEKVLHLKTGLAYLEKNNLLVSGEFTEKEEFLNFNKTIIPPEEAYAANCIWVNDFVIMPAGFPKTKAMIASLNYEVLEVELTEFEKLDGGASCLSLRF